MSQPPKPLEFGISQASILDIYERTTALTVAQMELRNQTLSDAELAEFELSLQNWVIEYLWPAPKPSENNGSCAMRVDESDGRTFLPLDGRWYSLSMSKDRWLRNIENNSISLVWENRTLNPATEYKLTGDEAGLTIRFTGLPMVTPTGNLTVNVDWSKNIYFVNVGDTLLPHDPDPNFYLIFAK